MIGPSIHRTFEFGTIIKNRMLVISSLLPETENNSKNKHVNMDRDVDVDRDMNVEVDVNLEDDWSYESMKEFASCYLSNNIISIHSNYDYNQKYNYSICQHTTNYDEIIDNDVWMNDDVIRHERIANVISDWLQLLTTCGYLLNI